MASKGYVEQVCLALPDGVRRPILAAFRYILDNGRFGLRTADARADNFQGVRLDGTTSADANVEFSLPHRLNRQPTLAIPVLPLRPGATIVPLTVTRTADRSRVYLSSPSTAVSVSLYVEVDE